MPIMPICIFPSASHLSEHMINNPRYFLLLFAISIVIIACQREEDEYKGADARPVFSTDTLLFDTLFVKTGSVTKHFTVRNPYDESLRIDRLYLAGGDASPFRLNIDGHAQNSYSDYLLAPGDSFYVFVEVTIEPNSDQMLVKDSVVFELGANRYDVNLQAWGLDAHLIRDSILNTQTWTADKPYLVFGNAVLTAGQVLTIQPGTIVYFHKAASLKLRGQLIAQGTVEEPIIFKGDRLEEYYDDIPGQWDGIYLKACGATHQISDAEVLGAVNGLRVDSTSGAQPELRLSRVKIMHHTYAGLWAKNTTILADNCLIANCGSYCLAAYGGSYEFYHMTIANFYKHASRWTPSLRLSSKADGQTYAMSAAFANSIIVGNEWNEIGIDRSGDFSYLFDRCLVKVHEDSVDFSDENHFLDCMEPEDNSRYLFEDSYSHDYHLDTLTIAQDTAKATYADEYPEDLEGNIRESSGKPDLGAYERQ